MKRFCSVLLPVLIAACAPPSGAALASAAADIALVHVTVVDVETGRLLPDQTVLIAGSRIVQVASSARLRIRPHTQILEARGKYLIPGLWDMHTHALPRRDHDSRRRFLPLFIAHGVTGIRDMGSLLDTLVIVRQQAAAGSVLAPAIIGSGPILDGPVRWGPGMPLAWHLDGVDAARTAVDSLHRAGVDFLKVYSLLPRATYFAIVEAAKQSGLGFAGHVPILGGVTPLEASGAGQLTIEHLSLDLYVDCVPDGRRLPSELFQAAQQGGLPAIYEYHRNFRQRRDLSLCREVFTTIHRNGTWVVPTIVASRHEGPAVLEHRDLRYLSGGLVESCREAVAALGTVGEEERQEFNRALYSDVLMLHQAGVRLLAGTDMPNPCLVAGASLHHELSEMVAAGLTPLEALRTATLNPAIFLAADSLGTVRAGKIANLVLLRANPLEDINNTREIEAVVLRGQVVDRTQLKALLSSVSGATHVDN